MAKTEKLIGIYRGAGLNAPASNLIQMPSLTGTITEVYLDGPEVSDGDAEFELLEDGVSVTTITIADTTSNENVTGLSFASTTGKVLSLNLLAPIPAGLPDPPYSLIVTVEVTETHVALTGAQTVAGVKTFSSSPIVPTPSGSTDAANKAYVDSSVAGLSWKQAVRVATTADGTFASAYDNGSTVDGVSLATGDRILIKNQSDATTNGIYIVAASGAPTRATDADSGAELVNASVYVSEGTANADKQFVCTTNATITIGATNITFTEFSSGGGISDGDKGDITVSSSGTVFTIDNDVVTYAKMQNVSATSRILGRKTASAGDTEECTLSEVLDFIGSAAQGDILFRGAVGWQRLAAGSSGDFLKTLGAGADPEWDTIPGGGDLLSTNNLSDLTNAGTARTNLGVGTGDSPQFTAVNIGAATDTTVTRVSAGVIAVEGATIYAQGGALGTPASGTLTNCSGLPLSGVTDSTSEALGVGTLELGHASDTTLARVSAGVASIEGNNIVTANNLGTGVATQLANNANGSDEDGIGFRGIPQNSQSVDYTLVLTDSGKHIYQTGATKTVTIPANASVAFPLGTTVTFIATDAGGCTIAITTDTLRWAEDGSTGSVSLAQYGIATATILRP